MRYYVILDSGKIDAVIDTNIKYIPVGENVVTSDTHYWDATVDAFVGRQPMPLVVEGTRITNIPSTGTVSVTGPLEYMGQAVGDELNLTFDLPGVYTVTITPDGVPWLPTTVTIEVV